MDTGVTIKELDNTVTCKPADTDGTGNTVDTGSIIVHGHYILQTQWTLQSLETL